MDNGAQGMGTVARTNCRACQGDSLFVALDLGEQPLAGGFTAHEWDSYEEYETTLLVCSDCGLGQLSVDIDPAELYSKYNWRTSTSKSYLQYAWDFAEEKILPTIEHESDWVLEIASNDGYLLKYLQDRGVNVLGIDPAVNISAYAIADGVPVIVDFFSAETAKQILELKGYPKWIVANNVAAHTPDIRSFVEGLAILSGPDTVITIENPTIMNILRKGQFDTIFHEHYSYLSAKAVNSLATEFGLCLYDVENVPPQGGSNRYWLCTTAKQLPSVIETIADEVRDGLTSPTTWSSYSSELQAKVQAFHEYLSTWRGSAICGIGASAKASVVLNSFRPEATHGSINTMHILAVADDVAEKQGRYFPKDRIPIVSLEKMLHLKPDSILVFAWNIRDDLEKKLRNLGYTGEVWTWDTIPEDR